VRPALATLSGATIAGVSGLALLVSMFLPWFGGSDEAGRVDETFEVTRQLETAGVALTVNAWEAFSAIDFVLLAAALAALCVGLATAMDVAERYRVLARRLALGLGLLAAALILYRVGDPAPGQATEESGLFLGLAAAAGIAYGALRSMREAERTATPPIDRRANVRPGRPSR
jgi:hypothetical protein